ncbi:MAG: type II toxin-antitoxin system HicA family toxin [Clostridium thermopalmarium]|uniref:type II toxin-antitoxin system HicA family toxin n=1 Tax=Clostridium thermopalmarium TaxID=29373 RepID=UPI002355F4D1|nr:type II toxin-antitoxin system HicA family toxin [Clostridium thermopalmarium]MBE6043555.1 type II toxin-antitoxin system HicA family toxin [Clostridium thermopalmarium]
MKPQELIKLLTKEGWQIKNQRGSHIYLVHQTKPGKITIPYHNKDLKPGTLNSILKQAGLK